MNDAIGFYILSRVMEYMLFKSKAFNSDAYLLVDDLRRKFIMDSDNDSFKQVSVLINCTAWKLRFDSEVAA